MVSERGSVLTVEGREGVVDRNKIWDEGEGKRRLG